MSFTQLAEKLTERGLYVFPVVQNGKTPIIEGWPQAATRDPAAWEIEACNVGVFTGRFEDGALLVVDVDNKKGKCGDEAILELALGGFVLPQTYTVETPSGGRHLYFRVRDPMRSGVNVLGPGVDIRSSGGFVVGEGSAIDGRPYRGSGDAIADAPEWLIERCRFKPRQLPRGSEASSVAVDQDAAGNRARYYLTAEAPLAVEGSGGDATTFRVCAWVKDLGVEKGKALELLLEHWNPRCSPPWEAEALAQKLENAYRYGEYPPGSAAPEADFDAIGGEGVEGSGEDQEADGEGEAGGLAPPQEGAKEESYLEEMNKAYAVIYIEGSNYVLHETVDEKGAPRRVYLTEAAFKRKFSPYLVEQGGRQRPKTRAEIWLDWPRRREYAGVCFAPKKAPGHGYYNLWQGWAVKPTPIDEATFEAREGLRMFLEHCYENVCDRSESLHLWLIGYFAHMVQRPYERPLTTLVFKGKKGTGKNALVDRIGHIIGRGHYLVAHDGRYLTSNFNGHLDSCLCLVLDEAFWSGDKTAEGKLKGLSTAPTILIERKGKEPYSVDNLVRLVVIGNEEWLVPASTDERRYAVFTMGVGRQQDNDYFERLRVLLDHKGGAGVLLHYLENFDLSKVDVNRAPETKGLYEQKLNSLNLFHEYWRECLLAGEILGLDFGEGWPAEVPCDSLRDAFIEYKAKRSGRGWNPSVREIGALLRACASRVGDTKPRRADGKVRRVYALPPLAQARKDWNEFMRHEEDWQ